MDVDAHDNMHSASLRSPPTRQQTVATDVVMTSLSECVDPLFVAGTSRCVYIPSTQYFCQHSANCIAQVPLCSWVLQIASRPTTLALSPTPQGVLVLNSLSFVGDICLISGLHTPTSTLTPATSSQPTPWPKLADVARETAESLSAVVVRIQAQTTPGHLLPSRTNTHAVDTSFA